MTTKKEIEELESMKDMAEFQRKIATSLLTAMEYDQKIGAINRRLEILKYRKMAKKHSTIQ